MNINKDVPLKEIHNQIQNQNIPPNKRRRSLGFEMASIGENNSMNSTTNIPVPSLTSKHVIYNATEKNLKRVSGIPKKSTEVDLLHIKRLISSHKIASSSTSSSSFSPTSSSSPSASSNLTSNKILSNNVGEGSLRSRMKILEKTYAQDISSLVETQKSLDVEIQSLRQQSNTLETELLDLKRELKRVNQKVSITQATIANEKKKFDYFEEIIMKNVQHKEKLVNIQLEQLSNELNGSLDEIEFEMKQELTTAKSYKDEEVDGKLIKLRNKLDSIKSQLEETKNRKIQVLKHELSQLDKDLDVHLSDKTKETKQLTKQFEIKQENVKAIKSRCEDSVGIRKERLEQINNLQNKLKSYEQQIQKFETTKSQFISKQQTIELYSSSVNEMKSQLDEQLQLVKQSHDISKQKYMKQKSQQKMLENSIMDLEGKLRVFIRTSKLEYDLSSLYASKVMDDWSDEEAIDSYSLMIENTLLKNLDCSIIFSGITSPSFLRKAMGYNFNALLLRSQEFDLEKTSYSFSVSSSTNECQLTTISELNKFLECIPQDSEDAVTLHITANLLQSYFKSSITYVDLTLLPILRQGNVLREPLLPSYNPSSANELVKCLHNLYNNTKFLNFTTISSSIENHRSMIEVCELIHSIDSSYKS